MAQKTDSFDLGRLALHSGEGRRLDLHVPVGSFELGGERYVAHPDLVDAVLDVSHTTRGYALRLRFSAQLQGPCMRCLETADPRIEVDAREVDQPGGDAELESPYLDGDVLDVSGWARDALALALPDQITCAADCRGLCGVCGANLNDDPEHAHEKEPDPRWAALRELRLE